MPWNSCRQTAPATGNTTWCRSYNRRRCRRRRTSRRWRRFTAVAMQTRRRLSSTSSRNTRLCRLSYSRSRRCRSSWRLCKCRSRCFGRRISPTCNNSRRRRELRFATCRWRTPHRQTFFRRFSRQNTYKLYVFNTSRLLHSLNLQWAHKCSWSCLNH